MKINAPQFNIKKTGDMTGSHLFYSVKTIAHLQHIFLDEETRSKMEQTGIVYKVQALMPVDPGTEGGLFFGTTLINPGTVNDEYFMTQGHFHQSPNRAEYYWGLKGSGVLLLMNKDRTFRAEKIHKGSLHFIPAHTAHRVANTGDEPLIFNACWPSDAGHDYDDIIKKGFSCRLLKKNGRPSLVKI